MTGGMEEGAFTSVPPIIDTALGHIQDFGKEQYPVKDRIPYIRGHAQEFISGPSKIESKTKKGDSGTETEGIDPKIGQLEWPFLYLFGKGQPPQSPKIDNKDAII